MSSQILAGSGAIVTGGSLGIGRAVAEAFVAAGAHVLICGRGQSDLDDASAVLASRRVAEGQVVAACRADISVEADTFALVSEAGRRLPALDILVNNAGVIGPIGPFETADWNDWRRSVEINLFGSVLMCRAIMPHFRALGRGKIIQLSGGGAVMPDPRFSAYAAAKAGIARFVETIAVELAETHIDVNAVAPGAVTTRMNDARIAAGPDLAGREVWETSLRRREDGGTDPALCAALCLFLASGASDGLTGKLISATRDDWRRFPDRMAALMASDVYTLRRITPEDRGLGWPAG